MLLSERVVSRQRAFEGRSVKVDVCEVELPDGHRAVRELVEHPDVVCAVVLTRDGCVALVRQYRLAAGALLLEVPAGRIDPGETPEEAIRRELREEIGMVEGTVDLLARILVAPGFLTERLWIYLVREAVLAEPTAMPDEHLETVLVEPAEAVAMALDGRVQDAKSVAAVLAAARRCGF